MSTQPITSGTDTDYSQRSIGENLFDLGAWENLFKKITPVIQSGKDVYSVITGEPASNSNGQTTQTPATGGSYKSNLTWSDFLAMPNMPLLIGGAALLGLALYLRK